MAQTKQLKGTADALTPIEDFANAWGVSTKTVQNWVEFTYQAFEILLPSSGPFPPWAIELLTLCAKHVSQKAAMYFAETEETRRLKGTEYVRKVRTLRQAGHFQQFDQFRNVQSFQSVQPEATANDLEDEAFTELGKITRRGDSDLSRIKQTIEQREDAEIEELAEFIEDSDTRKMAKLLRRLKTGKRSGASVSQAIDVAYKRLPGS
ncbi:hypothetical protein [Egbenema bharatensis]|uniref:hypothetical protein n=1 Tax=Egbenema bharatensis TaxID=3463334 RepID=UPI003A8C1652